MIEVDAGAPMHRRFETIAGAQAQVDWGHEGTITTRSGELPVYSFQMVLSSAAEARTESAPATP